MARRKRRAKSAARAGEAGGHRVLLASEGRPFSDEAVRLAARLAREEGCEVRVVSIARVWGTSLGLPHPGLRPNKREMAQHEDHIAKAIRALKRAGVRSDGHIIASRKATRSILAEAARQHARAIVMGADPPRNRFVADMMWSQEAHRVRRRADVPVHLVGEGVS
jgi:nucleotide-binding universal stress UspA family protein